MKSLIYLTKEILRESGILLCTSTTRDISTVTSRLNTEGESFLTITLPTFARGLERALDEGMVYPSLFPSFKKARKGACLPAFLQGFMRLVFNLEDGLLLDNPSIEAIRCIRQICLLHSKLFEQTDVERTSNAILGYIKCEQDLKSLNYREEHLDVRFRRVARILFGNIFSDLDDIVYHLDDEIVPKYGPGATAERLSANGRWAQSLWTSRLEAVFPSWFMRIPNERHIEHLESFEVLEPDAELPVRVITVPKTRKTPRIIAIEPSHMMYVQQSLMRLIVKRIESDSILGKMIGFTDQTPNQEYARKGSSDCSLATLDLSEASDRVSLQHVEDLLNGHRWFRSAVLACRSRSADVPGYGVVRLSKFASMGSALTFPMEAMVFLTSIFLGIESELKRPLLRKDISALSDKVRVYGDDIIIPVDYVHATISTLNLLGFKVNEHKSFWTGKFRESCGKEYYDGHDVTVVKFRRRFPRSLQDAHGVQGLVAFRNQLYWHGWWQTCKHLDQSINNLLKGHFPILEATSPCLGRESVLSPQGDRIDPFTQDDRVKAWRPRNITPSDILDGVPALMKVLLQMKERDDPDSNISAIFPSNQSDHLLRSGRPERTVLNLRWSGLF